MQPGVGPRLLLILAVGSCRSRILAVALTMCGSGTTNVSPNRRVEPLRQVAGELEVLALVLADRHVVGVVQQDVGRLQHRVGEQPDVGASAPFGRLVLELGHPAASPKPVRQFSTQRARRARRRGSGTNSAERSGSTPPARYCAAVTPGALAQHRRVVLDGDRVQVDDAVEGVVVVLQADPLHQRAEVVAEVQRVAASAACPSRMRGSGRGREVSGGACAPLCQVDRAAVPGRPPRAAAGRDPVSNVPVAMRYV